MTIASVLQRFGLGRKQPEQPIFNRGGRGGNKPDITVRYLTTFGGAYSTPNRDYISMVQAGYARNSDVYAAVSLIASAGKQVEWDKSPGTNSAASLALLAKSGGPNYIEAWLSYILLAGNCYTEIDRNGANAPAALYLLQPDRVTPLQDQAAVQPAVGMYRVRDAKGAPYAVMPGDMMHSKLFNPTNPLVGMAPLEAAMLRVDAQNEGATLMKRLLERGYAPGWIEAAKDSQWEEEQVAQLKQRLKSSKSGGEEIFLENATYHQMGFAPIDSGVSEQQILTKRDIASVFHVPSQLIGDTQSQTYSNYQESRRALYMEAVIPLLSEFRDDWNRTIGRQLGSFLFFDKDSFDAIAFARSEATDRVHKLFTAGLITQNEARLDLEYDPADGGDTFFAPANFLPLAMNGTPPAAAPPPAPPKLVEEFEKHLYRAAMAAIEPKPKQIT